MIAALVVSIVLWVSWSVALTLLLTRYHRALSEHEFVVGRTLEHLHSFVQIALPHRVLANPALSLAASPASVALREALVERSLSYITACLLVVERRLSNRLTLMTELLSPFYVSLTKQQIPEKFISQYLQVTEPQFDAEGAIAAAENKVQETLLEAGKLLGGSEDPTNLRFEAAPSLQKLRSARAWLFLVAPPLTAALIASTVTFIVLACRG